MDKILPFLYIQFLESLLHAELEIFARRNFANFNTWFCRRKFYSVKILSCVNDYIEHMVILILHMHVILAKIYSTKHFCNIKVAGLQVGKIFVQLKFSAIILWYSNTHSCGYSSSCLCIDDSGFMTACFISRIL